MRRGNKAITADEQSWGRRRANGDSGAESTKAYKSAKVLENIFRGNLKVSVAY